MLPPLEEARRCPAVDLHRRRRPREPGHGRAGGSAAAAAPAPAQAALRWTGCATPRYPTLQCASLKVPLDHDRPGGRQISLALTRVPHTAATSQGPLLVNPGGPGGSGRSPGRVRRLRPAPRTWPPSTT